MAKTIALFFVLGLMVSCASLENPQRSISSLDQQQDSQPVRREPIFFERAHIR